MPQKQGSLISDLRAKGIKDEILARRASR